jgi:hypothetical protein
MSETLARHFSGMGEWLLLLGPLFLAAYFIPFFIAAGRKHRFSNAIGLINLLLGWTGIGWFAAIIWAVNRDVREAGEDYAPGGSMYFMSEPRLNETGTEPVIGNEEPGETRRCAFCAESIKAQARICRFCGRDVAATAQVAPPGSGVNIATIELNILELQALLRDHEEEVEQRFGEAEPATNYVAPQEENAPGAVPLEVARQLSGWKKFG